MKLKIIKFFVPILAVVALAALTLILGAIGGENSSLENGLPLWYGLTVMVVYLFLKRKYSGMFPDAAGISWKMPSLRIVLGLLFLTPLFQSLIQWTIILCNGISSFERASETIQDILDVSTVSVLFAPILEELLFRYAGMSPFASVKGKIYSLLTTSLLFGMLHMYSLDNFLRTAVMGLVFGLIFLKYRNIWCPIIFHFGCNLWVSAVYIMMNLNLPGLACNEQHNVIYLSNWWMLSNVIMAIVGILLIFYSSRNFSDKNATNCIESIKNS